MSRDQVREVRVGAWEFAVGVDGPESGEAVLMLHGFPQDRRSWDDLALPLAERGYRVVRPDQRGYSAGARPRDAGAYRLSETTADAAGILDGLGIDRAHVVGHDWGGAVAWSLAARHPDRVRTLTVLSTPHPAAMARSMVRSTQGLRSWYMLMFQVPGLAERLLRPPSVFWNGFMRGLPRDARMRYAEQVLRPGAATPMLHWYRAAARDLLGPAVPSVHVPVLYVRGGRDPALGPQAAAMTARYCTGPYRYVELPEHGHWLPERAAEVILPLLLEEFAAQS